MKRILVTFALILFVAGNSFSQIKNSLFVGRDGEEQFLFFDKLKFNGKICNNLFGSCQIKKNTINFTNQDFI